MKRIYNNLLVKLFLVFFVTSILIATIRLKNGQKYIMIQDVVGISTDYEHYFEMGKISNALLDGSENYYSISFEQPSTGDAFGLKMSGLSAKNDTIRRIVFKLCGDGIYIRGWGGGGGLITDCSFIENKRWGIRSGNVGNSGIEISYCNFRDNDNGIAVKTADSMWVHHNEFFADTTTGISLDGGASDNQARYNLIEYNYCTGHENYGIQVTNNATYNIIRANYLDNDPIYVENSHNNLFTINLVKDCETAIILNNSRGNVFESDTVQNSLNYDVSLNNNSKAHFITSVFDTQKVNFLDGESKLFLSWYLDVTVTGSGPVDSAVVKCYNLNGDLITQVFTNSEGKTDKIPLPEIAIDSSSTVTYTPYSVVTSKDGYGTDSTTVDMTENKSIDVILTTTSVEELERTNILKIFTLQQNYPNPFNPNTSISYQIPKSCKVSLKIYDINGKLVKILVDKFESEGYKSIKWDGRDNSGNEAASGIYIYSIIAGGFRENKQMVLMR